MRKAKQTGQREIRRIKLSNTRHLVTSIMDGEMLDLRVRRQRKESLSKLIREALSSFTKKKEHSVSTLPSLLPASSKDKYKTVTAYFPRDEWNLLQRISENTGGCKAELLRNAVEDFLKNRKAIKDRINLEKVPDRYNFA